MCGIFGVYGHKDAAALTHWLMAEALRRAMLGMASGENTALRDPALWAPFVFVGR